MKVDENNIEGDKTGSHNDNNKYKIIIYPFDKYEIKIKLTQSNEFVEILEIRINKDFLNYKHKMSPQGYHDVEEFYQE